MEILFCMKQFPPMRLEDLNGIRSAFIVICSSQAFEGDVRLIWKAVSSPRFYLKLRLIKFKDRQDLCIWWGVKMEFQVSES